MKITYANGVAIAAQMIPNGYSQNFCHNDYDTPTNSLGNGYVGSDSSGVVWAVRPWSSTLGQMTSDTSEYYLNTTNGMPYCKAISSDPDPSHGQILNTFSLNMPIQSSFNHS